MLGGGGVILNQALCTIDGGANNHPAIWASPDMRRQRSPEPWQW